MSKELKVGSVTVPVSDELQKEYYRMKRRERYMEEDVKVGRIDVDMENEKVTFVPNKEDSLQRLMDLGADYADEQLVEDLVVDKAMLLILQEAMKELDRQEKELIDDLFYKEMTVRDVAKKEDISHVAVIKRRDKVLAKLRKFF
ncbi:sigma-70 family RNA polymerase sigma factor [Anaerotalea alkaliphila]|uniref:Sigma-70 family RNA polymerase sigma factor n=1 Tax=Anaerotalea alkaliphila TaxID=2662126 RepID=A0A7X5HXV3_9FIRM|nr:sigma-70 family RNA polymerase sigma factor [Anaerotalea alkaliphila]NDL68618.1 sigma-70 family RNA polymerase sigma factor [Anaerotalea alkaliphila]